MLIDAVIIIGVLFGVSIKQKHMIVIVKSKIIIDFRIAFLIFAFRFCVLNDNITQIGRAHV